MDLFGPNIISGSRLFGNVIRGSLDWGIYHQTASGQLPQAGSVLTQGGSQLSDDAIQISAIPGADCLRNQGLNLVFEVVHGANRSSAHTIADRSESNIRYSL